MGHRGHAMERGCELLIEPGLVHAHKKIRTDAAPCYSTCKLDSECLTRSPYLVVSYSPLPYLRFAHLAGHFFSRLRSTSIRIHNVEAMSSQPDRLFTVSPDDHGPSIWVTIICCFCFLTIAQLVRYLFRARSDFGLDADDYTVIVSYVGGASTSMERDMS